MQQQPFRESFNFKPPLSGMPSTRRVQVKVDIGNQGISPEDVVLDPPNKSPQNYQEEESNNLRLMRPSQRQMMKFPDPDPEQFYNGQIENINEFQKVIISE
jgi:hypothetical protein